MALKIINIYPKDICVRVEFPLSDLKLLKEGLDGCQIISKNADASRYLIDDFFPALDALIKEVEG